MDIGYWELGFQLSEKEDKDNQERWLEGTLKY